MVTGMDAGWDIPTSFILMESHKEPKRQGLVVSIDELRNLADELESQCRQLNTELEIPKYDYKHKFQINIINKEGLSDTWEIESNPVQSTPGMKA